MQSWLMTDDEQAADPPLTPHQQKLVAALSPAQIRAIDLALLANIATHWRNVARVVAASMLDVQNRVAGIPDLYFAARVRVLVERGLIESQGDLNIMRLGEVRFAMRGAAQNPPAPVLFDVGEPDASDVIDITTDPSSIGASSTIAGDAVVVSPDESRIPPSIADAARGTDRTERRDGEARPINVGTSDATGSAASGTDASTTGASSAIAGGAAVVSAHESSNFPSVADIGSGTDRTERSDAESKPTNVSTTDATGGAASGPHASSIPPSIADAASGSDASSTDGSVDRGKPD